MVVVVADGVVVEEDEGVVVVGVEDDDGMVVFGAVPGAVPEVVSVTRLVEVEESTGSGSSLMTDGADVDVWVGRAAVDAEGISTEAWMTLLRTCATAPHENARAIVAANAQPATSFVHFGMTQLSHVCD